MVNIPKPKPAPPLQVRIPVIEDKTTFIKRMAAFALILLLLYYAFISFSVSRDNHTLLENQNASLARLTKELNQAKAERAALIKIAIAQNQAIKDLGGKPVDPLAVGLTPNGAVPSPSPEPAASPTKKSHAASASSPVPVRTSKPKPRPTPTAVQTPRPSPTPSPKPLLCVDTPLGRVCTPA